MKIAVFVSGGGTNLQTLIDAVEDGRLPNVEISMVMADRDCFAIERALDHEIRTYLLDRKTFSEDALHNLEGEEIDLIVLAGFLSILSKDFTEIWKNKMINIHPSLLPKFGGKGMYGAYVHKAVLEAKEKVSGATVHYVTAEVDEGAIICQGEFQVDENDQLEDLQRKVSEVEQRILVEAVKKISAQSSH
ncbi:phosphoribosylglycinamide formyltransferase [Weeksella virosa]|uniref:Phosphoribosylglycinamide formyltransferase n=1 Tax=Weeksella virosa (strain ATCC 43766 / DSM 16922 / JCM 21250 / CCUG 30538 / CDC 9751 / IAM 14551 / NBRC 16016 / NCTC 11634 / CL345/78) TaxID=865938 RepID=F0NZ17_WEEVC|nr:phosphoribosylglycinamide formyltransferase [Weeksella virosa]ADX68234.1 phosphoribosylglycinamide formyltransferase [Weeksella virosa DSM 16922]SUP54547.1 Phosphoribosylglycinamide formyltransferase [Weeksella virosa]VEH64129.1 Phosphoribosylglycinamide formyltransferase [Weeksella virosa]